MAATPTLTPAEPQSPDIGTRLSQTGRVEAFSDGVMAIAITLLVLDLKVPSDAETREAGSLIAALAGHWPSYLAYLAAFLTIGIIWLNHRAFVDKIRRFDSRLHWLNLALLLGVGNLTKESHGTVRRPLARECLQLRTKIAAGSQSGVSTTASFRLRRATSCHCGSPPGWSADEPGRLPRRSPERRCRAARRRW